MKRLLLIIIIGVFIRFLFAVSAPYAYINEDSSTIGLMARHILNGDIPMFFYGQYYQAPVEPMFVALFFLIFGINPISLLLAPIFFTGLLLIVTYLLGKRFGHPAIGFWAMMYLALPPYYLFHDSIMPLGYHIEILLIGEIILLLALKIPEGRKRWALYTLLGLVSGIGFWMSYLTCYFILATAIYLFFNESRINLIKNGLYSAVSFFLAGLPYWIFSIKHGFLTFKFPGGGDVNSIEVLKKFFTFDLTGLIGSSIGLWVYILAIIILIFYTIRARERRIWLLWFFLFSIIVLYTRGRYHAMSATYHYRYTSGVYIFVAFMLGYFTYLLNKRTIFVGSLTMIFLLGIHAQDISRNLAREKGHSDTVSNSYQGLLRFLVDRGITRLVGPDRGFRPLMFLSNERFICQEYMGSGYLGYDDIVERSPKVAFFNDIDFSSSLNSLCNSWKRERGFYYDFKPYPYRFREIPNSLWRSSSKHNLRDTGYAYDRNYNTYWCSKKPKTPGVYFYLDLARIYRIAKIQFFYANHYKNLPRKCKIEVSRDNKTWELVYTIDNPQPFFWSGPRPYWHLQEGRWEIIFKPKDARFIRFTEMGKEDKDPWEINELFIYECAGERDNKADLKSLKSAYAFLRDRGTGFIYADYWESARIRQWGGKALRPFNPLYFWLPDMNRLARWKGAGFIIKDENADGWERVIRGFNLDRRQFGRYYCYFGDLKNIYWIGITGVNVDLKEKCPSPKNKINIEFKNGVRFLGYTINTKRVLKGKKILIDYFWEVKKEPRANLAVFVHFVKDGEILFQNDHEFLFGKRERLKLSIPKDAPSGRYSIIIGLWDRDSGRRVRIKGTGKAKFEIGELEIEA